ncbi:molybdopterin-guanine dinucleotide biosynthesis protein B [Bacillus piscicola]|uniref:molybdopterin-guanine dinucleotide biosynthesis protein B n=1 Tax=Bacillus piscicola TaxID=1632684 RepID=UPI001F0A008F|nr:molybdopterin-guanine dinucleotide biosynthesis protein B [Bacillus piscicola]
MEQHCPVIQIIGYQNSGKTTLMEKLIHKSTEHGLQTASIKHHGHGGYPEEEWVEKDSTRHNRAGAFLSSAEGDGKLYLQAYQESWTLTELVRIYEHFNPDVIFVEGYKQASYPKIVLLREADDVPLLRDCSNIICVLGREDFSQEAGNFPFFSTTEEVVDFIFQKVLASV